MRAAIVGGGPAGLVAGLAARQVGLDVDIYERANEFADVGTVLALARNGLRALDSVGVLDELRPKLTELPRGVLVGERGRVLARLDMRRGSLSADTSMTTRFDLIRCLADAAERAGANLHLKCPCAGVRQGGLRLADGSTVDADVVLGADGVHSVIRDDLHLGGSLRPLGWAALRALVPIALQGEPREIWLPNKGVLLAPAGASTYLALMAPLPLWADFQAERFDSWKRMWDDFGDEVMERVRAIEDWHSLPFDEIREVKLRRWSRDGTYLLGDAAHAMSPDLGQGANSAMVDGVVLARLLGDADAGRLPLESVGHRYESVRKRFVQRLQRASRMGARSRFLSSSLARRARDTALKLQSFGPIENSIIRMWAGYNKREEPYLQRWTRE